MSVLTAAALVGQLVAGATLKRRTFPIMSYAMFADNASVAVDFRLHAHTRSGRDVAVPAADFGLTRKQLRSFLGPRVAPLTSTGPLEPGASSTLARIVGVWNKGHPSDPAVSMRLDRKTYALPAGPWRAEPLLTWGRP